MELLYAILLFVAPILLALLFTRIYNLIQGLVTFLFGTYLMVFLSGLITKIGEMMTVGDVNLLTPYTFIYNTLNGYTFDKIPNVASLAWNNYIYFGGVAFVFLVFWIIASSIKKSKREKQKLAKRVAHRY